jgi:hypothetical protein
MQLIPRKSCTFHVHDNSSLCIFVPEDVGPNGVITIKGDVRQVYDYDWESCEKTDALLASVKLQSLKKAMVESPPDPMMLEVKAFKLSIQPEEKVTKTVQLFPSDRFQVMHIGNSLYHKYSMNSLSIPKPSPSSNAFIVSLRIRKM